MTEREARTNFMGSEIDKRNRNWSKVDRNTNDIASQLTDYEALIGEIKMYAGSAAPNKHLLCNGAAVSRTTYAKLFAVIGTTYGSGNGSTTFNLPNFKGRIPVGYDNGQSEFNTLGKTGGSKTHTLVENEMPKHDHGVSSSGTASGALDHAGKYIAACGGTSVGWSRHTATAGNNSAHNNLQPYISVNYIIRVQ